MNCTILAATALIASSFSPIALPVLVSGAAALPSPNVLLCTDTSSLGPAQNGHFWGSPYILPVNNIVSTTFAGPFSSGETQYYVVTTTTTTHAVIQRCTTLNRGGNLTAKYQDVEVAPADTVTEILNCQSPLTAAGTALGYVQCPTGGSGDDRGRGSGDDRRPPPAL